jgi:hypothetical protein
VVIYRLIAPEWLTIESPSIPKVLEGEFTDTEIKKFNEQGYNVYYLPNYPSLYTGGTVDGSQVDTFEYVFVDMDLKEGKYKSKDEFVEFVCTFPLQPTKIIDSGNGIHVYWRVSDLNAKSYLLLQRRLTRHFKSDEAVSKIYQLMRYPGTLNTKMKGNFKACAVWFLTEEVYTCETIDKALAPITLSDEQFCNQHFEKTYKKYSREVKIDEKLPSKFGQLLHDSQEVKDIWLGNTDDRSKSDFRLGHIMFASGFTKKEATSVLVNSAKALERAPIHRLGYAEGIVNQIWTFESSSIDNNKKSLSKGNKIPIESQSVFDILQTSGDKLKGERFYCWPYVDNTEHGFRLSQVVGMIAGSGVGKTAIALNMFEGFVSKNPSYDHLFVTLEQPAKEIAERWKNLCGTNINSHHKVRILSNYDDEGNYRNLSFDSIQEYILNYQKENNVKIGCVVIDHIGALQKSSKDGRQSVEDICHKMKSFAVSTNTLLVMQSQAPREKAGIGDLELNKDAAYGTVFFESYCDYLITLWQPLKRVYKDGAPTVTAFKFCKIRHKNQNKDVIKEDLCYRLKFDADSQRLREMTQDEEAGFSYHLKQATAKRSQDRKTEMVEYVAADFGGLHGKTQINQNT